MKLLIITQTVDHNDPVLGFFHRWIVEFSKKFSTITVICLKKGDFELPSNVKVLSLGKESGRSKLKYLWRFYHYLWQERKEYDAVFVHMNQEYILLGAPLWHFWGKTVMFWRNHPAGNWLTTIAVWLSDRVFCTSKFSYTARFGKTTIMPVGIDTVFFVPGPSVTRVPRSILALGRISPVKYLEILIQALLELHREGVAFSATIVGSAVSSVDQKYEKELHQLATPLIEANCLTFQPAVVPTGAPKFYQTNELYVNLTPTGSMDKTIFEAMACGAIPIITNQSLVGMIPEFSTLAAPTPATLAAVLRDAFKLPDNQKEIIRQNGRQFVEREHALPELINRLCALL